MPTCHHLAQATSPQPPASPDRDTKIIFLSLYPSPNPNLLPLLRAPRVPRASFHLRVLQILCTNPSAHKIPPLFMYGPLHT